MLVHDAARPFCPTDVIDRLLASLEFFDGAAPVLPVGIRLRALGFPWRYGRSQRPRPRSNSSGFSPDPLTAAYDSWSGTAPTDETLCFEQPV